MGERRVVQRMLMNPTRFNLRVRLQLPDDLASADDVRVWSFEPTAEIQLEPQAQQQLTVTYTSVDTREHRFHECALSVRNAITDEVDIGTLLICNRSFHLCWPL